MVKAPLNFRGDGGEKAPAISNHCVDIISFSLYIPNEAGIISPNEMEVR